MAKIGIIGGTGFSEFVTDYKAVDTDYGPVKVGALQLGGKDVAFISRHAGLEVPHLVNYRANIQALKLEGVDKVYAVSACGRLGREAWPGSLGAVKDVDWDDLGRVMTFAEPGLLLHASMDEPFSQALRKRLFDAFNLCHNELGDLYDGSSGLELKFHNFGTYFNIDGPAFSTPAREARLRTTVHDALFIGQTLVPEVHLAREMAIAYSALAMCVDHSNFPGAPPVAHADGVMHAVKYTAQAARILLDYAVRLTDDDLSDPAHGAFKHSLHSSQVDLERLERSGRKNLTSILCAELESR